MANEIKFKIKEQAELGYKELNSIKNFISNYELLVGIPGEDSNNERKGNEQLAPTNAELLYIHTNGSRPNNIPARPVIEPALMNSKDKITNDLSSVIKSVNPVDNSEALNKLQRLGLRAQNMCRAWFTNPLNGWKPNSKTTIRKKMKKGSTDPKPLIDTGQLRKSITYVIKTRGGMVK